MYQKILLAVDGSENSQRAAQEALKLAKCREDAEVTILFANVPPHTAVEMLQNDPNRSDEEILEDNNITSVRDLFEEAGVKVKCVVLRGEAIRVITDYEKKNDHDLLVIGSRGLGSVGQLFLGSVSTKVINKAKCPVLLVK